MEIDLTNLCCYDRRNPDFEIREEYGYSPEEVAATGNFAKKDCYCDNCFYGRAKLTEQLLEMQSKNKKHIGISIKSVKLDKPTALGIFKDTKKIIIRDKRDIPRGEDVVLCLEDSEGNIIASNSRQLTPNVVISTSGVISILKVLNEFCV